MSVELGPVLVVGGCGFLGHHIVAHLMNVSHSLELWVLDLDTSRNRYPRVTYCDGDIGSKNQVHSVLHRVKPRTIFHTASPNVLAEHPSLAVRRSLYERVNVLGTRNLIECAGELGDVVAFIYTSSASVVHDSVSDLYEADESLPVLRTPEQQEIYSHTKGIAEQIVLSANRKYGKMLTAAIRPVSMFGEDDAAWIPNLMDVYRSGKSKVQLGPNTTRIDLLYVGNSVHAHLLAANALHTTHAEASTGSKEVDGEAFFVTNDEPYRFWDFAREVWTAAGDGTDPKAVWIIPKRLGLIMATIAEWIFWVIYWGTKEPKLTRRKIKHTCMNRTFRTEKARNRLGYRPQVGMQEAIRKSVTSFLDEEDVKKKNQ
ncbi:MAG: hypothetical protein LQ338_004963 [Usnochroma carphineum]|nr:MAG: hypothetical protein LQ338_004963 [Usnochroma carphineum]